MFSLLSGNLYKLGFEYKAESVNRKTNQFVLSVHWNHNLAMQAF